LRLLLMQTLLLPPLLPTFTCLRRLLCLRLLLTQTLLMPPLLFLLQSSHLPIRPD
jgi:hypothetical protein